MTATCGANFEHEWHSFRNEQGHIEVCDGSITKPRPPTTQDLLDGLRAPRKMNYYFGGHQL